MPKIGICMIVKDESKVIVRCLESVKTFAPAMMLTIR